MTRQRTFKHLVRTRMAKTGESYTAARAILLSGVETEAEADESTPARPILVTSDATIRERTGRGWEEWFDLLDGWKADELSHKEIARRVADELGIEPLVWEAQAVTYSYERSRGLREVGQRSGIAGFTVTVTRTVAVPVADLYRAFVDETRRGSWLPDGQLTERTATEPKSARYDWADGTTRVNVTFAAKGGAKSTVVVEHSRLADGPDADKTKSYWGERLDTLRSQLESASSG